MSYFYTTTFLVVLLGYATVICCSKEVEMAHEGLVHALSWAQGYKKLNEAAGPNPFGDCIKLYEDAEIRLKSVEDDDDAVTWLSAALASHLTCLDGLPGQFGAPSVLHNLTLSIREALATYGAMPNRKGVFYDWAVSRRPGANRARARARLASWDPTASKADFVVAQDGSGNYKTINEAVSALSRLGNINRRVIYVKSGIYKEKVEIGRDMKNVMFVGDGMDKTVITGNQNVQDGATTFNSATFGVSGDGFWARDMTFENTAGPQKHQAVALRVASDLSVFYRCSFKGYQDTLLVHSLRQFYRDCHIYGTVDFIFGDAAAVFQNCDIFVRRPMDHQSNMITAQGRDDPNENTGISIVNCRVGPAPDFVDAKGRFKSYLGRPWKKYSRTVFLKTDLDGLVDEKGWSEWNGDFALSTLYYGEYMNMGMGASTSNRVKWPGFHVLSDTSEASRFTVRNFIGGDSWIPATGVPFWAEL